ncbi:MAG: 50S ribosomal protein L4 [Patescibacteria group bacterium]|nr:50S ribosomal protein L4 [bacterium]MDZ4240804.1 50S ribosomal protein L4 [Patescibacteria group bacterium]
MEAKIYNQEGKEVKTVALPEDIFSVDWNADLVHQVTTSILSNARNPIAHTKDRSEVRGGGIKPWRQKGTGRARHGSTRSPIWVGGGVAHGPRNEKKYGKKVNKKMRTKALYAVLSRKHKDGEILFINSIAISKPSTKTAKGVVSALSSIKGFEFFTSRKRNLAYIALPKQEDAVERSFRNFGNLSIEPVSQLNIVDVLNNKYLVVVGPDVFFKTVQDKKK